MPDWISHLLIGLILCEVFYIKKGKSLVLLGTLLPDIFLKIKNSALILPLDEGSLAWTFMPFHTGTGALVATILILPSFRYDKVKTFLFITLGWISHFASDLMNKHLLVSQMYPIPFSWHTWELGWIHTEQYWIFLLFLIPIYIYVLLIKKHLKNKKIETSF